MQQAVKTLKDVVLSRFGKHSSISEEVERATLESVDQLAAMLRGASGVDPLFEQQLRQWIEQYRPLVVKGGGDVSNIVGGAAQVHGHVIQGRDFNSINLNSTGLRREHRQANEQNP